MNDRHELLTLLALVRGRWDEAEQRLRQRPVDPEIFESRCVESDVHPWIHSILLRRGWLDRIGADAAQRLARRRAKVSRDNLLLLARAEQALDLLLEAGITPVALKGLDFLHRLYDGFDERTIDDVDLLIRTEELQLALEVLQSSGWTLPPEPLRTHYIRSSHHVPLLSPGPITVDFEIHWNLAQEGRYRIDREGLLNRAIPVDIGGRPALRLEDHDLVAHLLVHHFSHYFDRRLKWLVDLQAIAAQPGFRWHTVVERVRSWGATVSSAISLRHWKKLDPDRIPDEALVELPVALWRRLLTLPLRSDHPLDLFRGTQRRRVQLYLAAVMLERPHKLPAWLLHRAVRDRRPGPNPLDREEPDPASREEET